MHEAVGLYGASKLLLAALTRAPLLLSAPCFDLNSLGLRL
jgi:hypothetical protein